MAEIEFSSQQKNELVAKLQTYFDTELEYELGQFDAEFLLDFFAKELGATFYNQGLTDAQTVFAAKLDDVDDALFMLRKED